MRKTFFFIAVGIATLINELGIQYGYVLLTFPLSMLAILWLALKTFPAPIAKETEIEVLET
jgi:hypothetical protein